jgi:hypothetical protein
MGSYHGLDLQLINNVNKKNVYYTWRHSQSASLACGAASSGETDRIRVNVMTV